MFDRCASVCEVSGIGVGPVEAVADWSRASCAVVALVRGQALRGAAPIVRGGLRVARPAVSRAVRGAL